MYLGILKLPSDLADGKSHSIKKMESIATENGPSDDIVSVHPKHCETRQNEASKQERTRAVLKHWREFNSFVSLINGNLLKHTVAIKIV